ncbi:unnamed protein product [Staurois parvus]|uniref:Ig-like domain-containing protein n=1 Tax=Staurois parvus TaxID=386267 RepID=A0ABN9DDZ8_9NEOB|nr:unnamed protein product [Staurois parvus]
MLPFICRRNQGQSIDQTSAPQVIQEGDSLLLECTYKISGNPYLFWYVLYPGQAPTMLLNDLTRKSEKNHKGFTGTHESKKKSYNMNKNQVEVSDSAMYFCAVSDTVNKTHSSPVT